MAASIWGDPTVLIGSFNTTLTALKNKCKLFNHMPVFIDDIMLWKPRELNKFVDMMCSGEAWQNIIITAGEKHLTGVSSHEQVMQIHGKAFNNPEDAEHAHRLFEKAYGTVGPVYIEGVKTRDVKSDYESLYKILKKVGENHCHLSHIAVICLGDFYGSMFIWNKEEKRAFEQARDLGVALLMGIIGK